MAPKLASFALILIAFAVLACSEEPRFDSERAYADLEKICSFGPRVANTQAHLNAGEFIYSSLRSTTDLCRTQRFSVFDSTHNLNRKMFNMIASYYPDAKKRIMLCAHWDSRPVSDMESDSSKVGLPVLGANDGVSGVAVLLEIGRILKKHKPQIGVDIVLFDGEDYGSDKWPGGWFLGSAYFAEHLDGYRPGLAILLDMIGDSDLQIYREAISETYAKDLNDYIWKIAAEQGSLAFVDSIKHTVSDDHIPLLSKGIKTIDIIDFDYPYWHTQEDTPDKCSAESLDEIGKVLLAAIFDDRINNF